MATQAKEQSFVPSLAAEECCRRKAYIIEEEIDLLKQMLAVRRQVDQVRGCGHSPSAKDAEIGALRQRFCALREQLEQANALKMRILGHTDS